MSTGLIGEAIRHSHCPEYFASSFIIIAIILSSNISIAAIVDISTGVCCVHPVTASCAGEYKTTQDKVSCQLTAYSANTSNISSYQHAIKVDCVSAREFQELILWLVMCDDAAINGVLDL